MAGYNSIDAPRDFDSSEAGNSVARPYAASECLVSINMVGNAIPGRASTAESVCDEIGLVTIWEVRTRSGCAPPWTAI